MWQTLNNSFLQCFEKWLKWAIAFHIAEFSKHAAHFMQDVTAELYSKNKQQRKDHNVKSSKNL
jgi:hypothetical protein